MDTRTDEQLVAAHLTGERDALAGMYDRYADALHDTAVGMLRDRHEAADAVQDVFLTAMQRLDQLRDPSRLRPWLYAILRNDVYRRTERRRREQPTDLSASGGTAMAAPDDPPAAAASIERAELADSVRTAAAGLDPRDQLVMELSVRQGLAGADLAAALGVSTAQSYVLVHRMRHRVARSLGALTIARAGRQECATLDRILAGWDGAFTVLIRKRVARHVDDCAICGETARRRPALALFAAAPAIAAPPELRARVLEPAGDQRDDAGDPDVFTSPGGFPTAIRPARRPLYIAAALMTLVLIAVGVAIVLRRQSAGDDASATLRAEALVTVPSTVFTTPARAATTTFDDISSSSSASTNAPTITSANPSTTTTTTVGPTTTTTTTATTTTSAPPIVEVTAITNSPPTASTIAPIATTSSPPTPAPPPAPGFVELSSTVVDLGADTDTGVLTVTNTGGMATAWTLQGDAAPFDWTADSPILDPGESARVEFTLDRSQLPEQTLRREVTITTDDQGGGTAEVRARIERPPVVQILQGPREVRCPASALPFVTATVDDESDLSSVQLSWSGPGAPGSGPMRRGASTWTGRLDNEQVDGAWDYVVTATDERGNVGRADGTFIVDGC